MTETKSQIQEKQRTETDQFQKNLHIVVSYPIWRKPKSKANLERSQRVKEQNKTKQQKIPNQERSKNKNLITVLVRRFASKKTKMKYLNCWKKNPST